MARTAQFDEFRGRHRRHELLDGDDELSGWIKQRNELFLAADAAALQGLREVVAWAVNSGFYTQAAANDFASKADAQLVGHARAHGLTVVSHERAQDTPTKVKIPNACTAMGVAHCDVFDVLRGEGARFVLAPSAP